MQITTVGIDLAKLVFQVHAVDEAGKTMLKRQLKHAQMATFFVKLQPSLIGMEACGSAHHWARKLKGYGHEVKLMAPQFVKPYVKSNKNDAADAEAICEAVGRPNMRFVAVKSVEQQTVMSMHRVRAGYVKSRTAHANQIRGLLAEFGLSLPQGIHNIAKRVPELLEDASNELTGPFRLMVLDLVEHVKLLADKVAQLELQIKTWHREHDESRKLDDVRGVGPLTASAFAANIGDVKAFKNGRQVSAWLGIVPKQHSSGGKDTLLGISKRGDRYLRTLLIHGARSVVQANEAKRGTPAEDVWISRLVDRRNKNVAAVAVANKNVRIMWALLAHEREYRADYKRDEGRREEALTA
jgi:transposase